MLPLNQVNKIDYSKCRFSSSSIRSFLTKCNTNAVKVPPYCAAAAVISLYSSWVSRNVIFFQRLRFSQSPTTCSPPTILILVAVHSVIIAPIVTDVHPSSYRRYLSQTSIILAGGGWRHLVATDYRYSFNMIPVAGVATAITGKRCRCNNLL